MCLCVLALSIDVCLCVVVRLLRQLRKNRDDEKELMKRVPGWVTGTLWGEPTSPRVRGQFPIVHPEAYFAHNHPHDMYDHLTERKWH